MRPTTIRIFGLATLVMAALAVGWREAEQARDAEAAAAATRRKSAALAAEERQLTARIAQADDERARLRATLDELRVAKPAAIAPAKLPAAPPNPSELLRRDPKLQVLFLAAERAKVARAYGPFLRGRGLTPEQAAKFADLLTHRTEEQYDLAAVAQERGLSKGDPEIAVLQQRSEDAFAREQIALLGQDGYAQLKDYERARPAREIVERFVGAAVVANMPLTAQQAEQFTQVVSTASSTYQTGGNANPATIDWAKVDAQAGSILSPAQLALFQHVEPIGGGPSRWMSRVDQTLSQAKVTTSLLPSASGSHTVPPP